MRCRPSGWTSLGAAASTWEPRPAGSPTCCCGAAQPTSSRWMWRQGRSTPRSARPRADPRVTVVEGVNARALDYAVLPYLPELVVVDVSFISVRKVLPAVLACSAAEFDCLALVKPQFELGPDRVGKGGVVRSAGDRRAALVAVTSWAHDAGFALLGVCSSGLPGPAGNRESFVWLGPGGRAGAVEDVERGVLEVEP